MSKIILYGTQYGTAKIYAQELGQRMGIRVLPFDEANNLQEFDTLIHIGGVLEEGVDGLKAVLFKAKRDCRLVVVTVGLGDIDKKETTDSLKLMVKKQISPEDYKRARIFHLRGGLDIDKMNFLQKIMIKSVYKKIKKKPAQERTDEMEAMIASIETKENFIDFSRLEAIIEYIKNKG